MGTEQKKTVAELADELVSLASSVRKRVADDGQILGWRGFHIDLDRIAEVVEEIPVRARGI